MGLSTFQYDKCYFANLCSGESLEAQLAFLEGAKAALRADQKFEGGDYIENPEIGMDACESLCGWVFSQDFSEKNFMKYWNESVEDVVSFMKGYFGRREPNDLIAMIETWQSATLLITIYKADFEGALRSISCKAIVMPSRTDLYFRVEDSENEVKHMPSAELRVIDSKFGHVAGSGMDPGGKRVNYLAIKDLLS